MEEMELTEQDLCRVFTVPEVAKRLRTNDDTIRKLIAAEELRAWRLQAANGHWRISAKSLMDYISRRDEEAESASLMTRKSLRVVSR